MTSIEKDAETVRALVHTNISWTFPQQAEAIEALDRMVEREEAYRAAMERVRIALEAATTGPMEQVWPALSYAIEDCREALRIPEGEISE